MKHQCQKLIRDLGDKVLLSGIVKLYYDVTYLKAVTSNLKNSLIGFIFRSLSD